MKHTTAGQQEAMGRRDRTPLCGVDSAVLPLYLGYGVVAIFLAYDSGTKFT